MSSNFVISGISGRYPEAPNFEILWDKLCQGVPLYSSDDRRWPVDLLNLPKFFGKVDGLTKMDASFFDINPTQANYMDPQLRMLHEVVYETIWDAGIDPDDLRGSKTGFYLGACYEDTLMARREDDTKQVPYLQLTAMRISYAFDFRGPLSLVDTACASSFSCLHEALLAIQAGHCDRAIVAGLALHLRPLVCKAFHSLNMLSTDGLSKCLDKDADGYQRSEAIVALLIEKESDSKRIYARIIKCRTNTDGYKVEGITFPKYSMQCQLMKEIYAEANIDPERVEYVEAHVTGTAAGDPVESQAILDAMRPNSTKPIMFGCLKSNMGHTEGASAVCSLSKVAKIFQKGMIPPNINFKEPNPNIDGLMKGIIKPVLKKTLFQGDIIGVNSFGFGGVNVHAIMQANPKRQDESSFKIVEDIPRIINICNRTREGINFAFQELQDNVCRLTRDQLKLIHDVSKISPSRGMNFRGSLIVSNDSVIRKSFKEISETRPIWFIFSPLGSQWSGMGKQLKSILPCWESILKSAEVVKSLNYDLVDIITREEELTDIVDVLLGITSIQMALVDLLDFVGMKPDGIIGHSVGELAASYADGCASREQVLKTAYYIAKIGREERQSSGLMAAIGLSWSEAKQCCPERVWPACNNSSDIVTVAGDEEAVKKFINQLNSKSIFAKPVSCCNIAYHSENVSSCYQSLHQEFGKIYQNPIKRSSKWISCVDVENVDSAPEFVYLTATYHANMVTKAVNFLPAIKRIPSNAAVIEIGPNSIMLGLMRKELGSSLDYTTMMKRDDDNIINILASIGSLYMAGHWPKIDRLYPRVDYPVARETESIGHLIKWDHSDDWHACKYPEYFNQSNVGTEAKVEPVSRTWRFVVDHVVDGRILFPATGYLYLIWKQIAYVVKGCSVNQHIPIVLRNVRLLRATLISPTSTTTFKFELNDRINRFEISESGSTCVTGYFEMPEDVPNYKELIRTQKEYNEKIHKDSKEVTVELDGKDVYKELRVRGYDYGPAFQGIVSAKSDASSATIKFMDHWISFVDSCLQVLVLSQSKRALMVPTFFESIRCDPNILYDSLDQAKANTGSPQLEIYFDRYTGTGITNGLIIKGMRASKTNRRQNYSNLVLENCQFSPYIEAIDGKSELVKGREQYQDYCNQYLNYLINGGNDFPSKDAIKSYLDSDSVGFSLLKMLHAIVFPEKAEAGNEESKSEDKVDVKDLLRQKIGENQFKLVKDILVSRETDNDLRNIIDIVAENTTSKNIVLSEVNFSDDILIERVCEILQASGIRSQNFLIHADPEASSLQRLPAKLLKLSEKFDKLSEIKLNNFQILVDGSLVFCPSKVQSPEQYLLQCYNMLEKEAFLLIKYRTRISAIEEKLSSILGIQTPFLIDYRDLKQVCKDVGLVKISEKVIENGSTAFLLLRKTDKKVLDDPIVVEVRRDNYQWIEDVKTAVANCKGERRVWLTSSDAHSGVVGLINCIKKEPGCGTVRCLLSHKNCAEYYVNSELMEKDLVVNVVDENDVHGSYRYTRLPSAAKPNRLSAHYYLDAQVRGDLTSLQWYQAPHDVLVSSNNRSFLDLDDAEFVRAYYCALNFKDIMVATGRVSLDAYPSDHDQCLIGMEFSGYDARGRRVLGLCKNMGIASSIVTDSKLFTWQIPDNWSMADACTVPVVYITCYYALFVRGNLKPGEVVLIHAGSGGVGQAAISICLRRGCKVFTTVGTKEKREFLKKTFPQLDDDHIADSRSVSFEDFIKKRTNGRGVDVVLNSLAEEKLQASLRCLADSGRFLEIGKYDIVQDSPLDPLLLDHNKQFQVVCVAHLMDDAMNNKSHSSRLRWKIVSDMFSHGLKSGEVRPLPKVIFKKDQIETAFRFMAAGKHIGKVLIEMRDENTELTPIDTPIPCISQTYFISNKSYIITGGLGGVGLELTYWMVQRGARKLILTSRTGIKNKYQKVAIENIKRLAKDEVKIIVSQNQATSYASAALLIEEAKNLGPVGGIFNLAMVLSDAILENQKPETFELVCTPKVQTSIYLDKITRKACSQLDYFVCFSSAASGKGNPGQTNYGFANSVMERVCDQRRRDGLHGLAIQWGAVGDVGIVAELLGGNDVVFGGTVPQRINSCMEVLDQFLQSSYSVCSSIVMADNKKSFSGNGENLLKTIYHILGINDPSTLEPKASLSDLGMDSLMAVEIKQGLERDYDIVMSTQALRNLTVGELQQLSTQIVSTSVGRVGEKDDDKIKSLMDMFRISNEIFGYLTDARGPPIFFFPPIEGNFISLKPLADMLQHPIVGVNWTQELDEITDIESVTNYYADAILKQYPNHSHFSFVGYSFGGLIALLVAIELQERSVNVQSGKIALLDSSPDLLKASITELMKRGQLVAEEEAYVELLIGLACSVAPVENANQLRDQLLGIPGREAKIKKLSELVGNQGVERCDAGLLGSAADRYFKKMKMVYTMNMDKKYTGDILLIKASENIFRGMQTEFEPDYGLSKITSGKLNIVTLNGDHKSFLVNSIEEIAQRLDAYMIDTLSIA